MNILMLTPYLPFPLLSGGQIRTYNLLKKLAKHHNITLFALIKEESERQYIPELEKFCHHVRVFKRSSRPFTLSNIIKTGFSTYPFLVVRNQVGATSRAIKQELKSGPYDLIHAETFYMMPNLPATNIPTILVEQTIEYLGYESFAQRLQMPVLRPFLQIDINKIKRWEKFYWRSCSKLVVMSTDDKQYIGKEITNTKKIAVVENGVDTAWFAQKKQSLPQQPTVLFVGTFKWLPNVEAVNFLVKQVWPLLKKQLPTARLWIVGNAPTKQVFEFQKQDTSITVTGGIPDIRDAFQGAHVLAAPVFSGRGTRYKILEAMASMTPIVATGIAVEGLGITENKHVLVANTAQTMADTLYTVLTKVDVQTQLRKNGLAFVKEHYDWHNIAIKLDTLYRSFEKI